MNALNVKDELDSIIRSKLPNAAPGEFIRYGVRKGKQIYLHKPTGQRFIANGALPGRRVSPAIVGQVLADYYNGHSYRDIQLGIQARHGFKPSSRTLYRWLREYVNLASDVLGNFKANTGSTWVADEMVVKIDGKNLWLWSVMDARTRYLLATHLSTTRTIQDAETIFRQARRRATHSPQRIITDGLAAYSDGIERVFGAETRHTVSEGIRSSELNNNLAERLNGTIRERTKVMRGMETKSSAELTMEGFRIHYNHMKPHHGLGGRTPAKAAGILMEINDWVDVARLRQEDAKPLKDTTLESRLPPTPRLRGRMPAIRLRARL